MTAREHVHIHKVEIKAFPWLANITSSILATTNGKSCTCRSQENQAFLSFFAVGMSTENQVLWKDLFERHCIRYVFWFLSDPQIQSATWTSAFLRPSCSRPRLSATSCPYHNRYDSKRQKENIGTSTVFDDVTIWTPSFTAELFFQPNVKPTPWALWCSFCWHLSSQPLEICYFHR